MNRLHFTEKYIKRCENIMLCILDGTYKKIPSIVEQNRTFRRFEDFHFFHLNFQILIKFNPIIFKFLMKQYYECGLNLLTSR